MSSVPENPMDATNKLAQEMSDTNELPPAWIPAEGETVVGIVKDVTLGWSKFDPNKRYPLLTLEKDDGELCSVHAFRYVLEKRILELEPRVGERIAIKFTGITKSRDGLREIYLYKVLVEGRTGEDIYASIKQQGTRTPQQSRPTIQELKEAAETEPDADDIPF